jgi:glycopeptide antibiotics resistance protein
VALTRAQSLTVPLIFAGGVVPQLAEATLRLIIVVIPLWCVHRWHRSRRLDAEGIAPADRRDGRGRELLWLTAILYGIVAFALTLYPVAYLRRADSSSDPLNLIPFRGFLHCAREIPTQSFNITWFCSASILGNVALFVPLGLLVPLLSRTPKRVSEIVLLGFWVSLGIEVMQFVEHAFGLTRTPDVDDLILNVVGARLGAAIMWMCRRDMRRPVPAPATL